MNKHSIETRAGEISWVDIIVASEIDIPALMKINYEYQREILEDNTKHGFLSAAFSVENIQTLIDKKEVVIGKFSHRKTIGYYLVNSVGRDGVLKKHQKIVEGLKKEGKLSANCSVGLGSQALVIREFQGTTLRKLMLDELVKQTMEKYDYLFSTISKENPRAFKAHTKDGWEVVGEDESTFHVVLGLEGYANNKPFKTNNFKN